MVIQDIHVLPSYISTKNSIGVQLPQDIQPASKTTQTFLFWVKNFWIKFPKVIFLYLSILLQKAKKKTT